jgi:hypothetical protein
MDTFSSSTPDPDWNRNNNVAFLNVPFVASTADLQTSVAAAAAAPGWARVVGQCTNSGPDAAVAPRCFFPGNDIPLGTTVSCSPWPFPSHLQVNETLQCVAEFVIPSTDSFLSLDATSNSKDPTRPSSSFITVPGASTDMRATLTTGTGAQQGNMRVVGR